jgi:hypothetical protein
VGEPLLKEQLSTDKASGKVVATATLPAGIYKAVFEIPAAGAVPAVKAQRLIEVIDADSDRYGVKRAFVMKSQKQTVEPGSEFSALVGTGYGSGRALVGCRRLDARQALEQRLLVGREDQAGRVPDAAVAVRGAKGVRGRGLPRHRRQQGESSTREDRRSEHTGHTGHTCQHHHIPLKGGGPEGAVWPKS